MRLCGLFVLSLLQPDVYAQQPQPLELPFLQKTVRIDANLNEWRAHAFTDGVWDLERVKQAFWYEPKRNRLVTDANEKPGEIDLRARYYMAWDEQFLYLGAEVYDNYNDVMDAKHVPKRWYYKDAIAWFIEAPMDTVSEKFGEGDHGFCFVMDTLRPDYGAWWRHGSAEQAYLEEPLPSDAVEYAVVLDPWGRGRADYVLEAKVNLKATLGQGDDRWEAPKAGDRYRMMIVHCDPDGGEYGGHLLIYGQGDDDATWRETNLIRKD